MTPNFPHFTFYDSEGHGGPPAVRGPALVGPGVAHTDPVTATRWRVNMPEKNTENRTGKGEGLLCLDFESVDKFHSPNLPYSKGIGSLAAAIPVLKVM